jgi:hypothetical protein
MLFPLRNLVNREQKVAFIRTRVFLLLILKSLSAVGTYTAIRVNTYEL